MFMTTSTSSSSMTAESSAYASTVEEWRTPRPLAATIIATTASVSALLRASADAVSKIACHDCKLHDKTSFHIANVRVLFIVEQKLCGRLLPKGSEHEDEDEEDEQPDEQ